MKFQRNWNLILLLIPFFFILSSCGSGGGSFSSPSIETSEEFKIWLNSLPTSPEQFVTWWNTSEQKNWKYQKWTSEFSFSEHQRDSAEEIYRSRLINCHRATILLMAKYSGEYLYIEQPGNYGHAVFQSEDSSGVFYISFAGLKAKFCRQYNEIFTDYK